MAAALAAAVVGMLRERLPLAALGVKVDCLAAAAEAAEGQWRVLERAVMAAQAQQVASKYFLGKQ